MSENTQDLREQLLVELKRHDWFFQYSDNFSEWSAGNAHLKLILDLVAKVPDGQALYEQHLPKG